MNGVSGVDPSSLSVVSMSKICVSEPVECMYCDGRSYRRGNISTHIISKHPEIAEARRSASGQVKAIHGVDYRLPGEHIPGFDPSSRATIDKGAHESYADYSPPVYSSSGGSSYGNMPLVQQYVM